MKVPTLQRDWLQLKKLPTDINPCFFIQVGDLEAVEVIETNNEFIRLSITVKSGRSYNGWLPSILLF